MKAEVTVHNRFVPSPGEPDRYFQVRKVDDAGRRTTLVVPVSDIFVTDPFLLHAYDALILSDEPLILNVPSWYFEPAQRLGDEQYQRQYRTLLTLLEGNE